MIKFKLDLFEVQFLKAVMVGLAILVLLKPDFDFVVFLQFPFLLCRTLVSQLEIPQYLKSDHMERIPTPLGYSRVQEDLELCVFV